MIRLPAPGSVSRSQSDQSRLDSRPTGWGGHKPHPQPLQHTTVFKEPQTSFQSRWCGFLFLPWSTRYKSSTERHNPSGTSGVGKSDGFHVRNPLRRLNIKRGGDVGTKAHCLFRSCVSLIQVFSGKQRAVLRDTEHHCFGESEPSPPQTQEPVVCTASLCFSKCLPALPFEEDCISPAEVVKNCLMPHSHCS